jgi:hypothetical protein
LNIWEKSLEELTALYSEKDILRMFYEGKLGNLKMPDTVHKRKIKQNVLESILGKNLKNSQIKDEIICSTYKTFQPQNIWK